MADGVIATIEALTRRTGLDFTGCHRERMVGTVVRALRAGGPTNALVDRLTVGESYFFREPAHLDVVRQLVAEARTRAAPDPPSLRVWSAGCASGEEAYTVAIVLDQERALASSRIVGTDLSEQAIAQSRAASYTDWSLRRLDRRERAAYFDESDGRFQLQRRFTQNVEFQAANILAGPPDGPFDLVLCRNVLIYLTSEAVAAAGESLRRALAPGGWIIVGSSDPPLEVAGLHRVPMDSVIAYRAVEGGGDPPAPDTRAAALTDTRSPRARRRAAPRPARPPAPRHSAPETAPTDEAAAVRSLAGGGKLAEAVTRVEAAIAAEPVRGELRYLAAVLHLRCGRPEAAASQARAALYLEPDLIVGHLLLAHAEQLGGDSRRAQGSFQTALDLLAGLPPDAEVRLAEGERAESLAAATWAARRASDE